MNPPCSGSVSPIWHLEMVNWMQKPTYEPIDPPYRDYDFADSTRKSNISLKMLCSLIIVLNKFMKKAQDRRHKVPNRETEIVFLLQTGRCSFCHRDR